MGLKVISRGLKEPLGRELSEVGREPKEASKVDQAVSQRWLGCEQKKAQ